MIQRGQHLGLTLESGHAFRIVREHLGQNSNTPSTDGREDLVSAEFVTDVERQKVLGNSIAEFRYPLISQVLGSASVNRSCIMGHSETMMTAYLAGFGMINALPRRNVAQPVGQLKGIR